MRYIVQALCWTELNLTNIYFTTHAEIAQFWLSSAATTYKRNLSDSKKKIFKKIRSQKNWEKEKKII